MRYLVSVFEWIVKDKHVRPVEEKCFTPSQKDEMLLYIIKHSDGKHQCCIDVVK